MTQGQQQQPRDLDAVACEVAAGRASTAELVDVFADATVLMPTVTDPLRTVPSPILTDIDGVRSIVIGTSFDSLAGTQHLATYAVALSGREILRGLQPGDGILVRTVDGAFYIDPGLAKEARTALGIRERSDDAAP